MPRPARVLGLLLLAATGGCAPPGSLNTSGPFDIDRAPAEGLRYYVTRDLLTIDAKVSTHHTAIRTATGGGCEPRDSVATSWTVTATTVPDRRQAYRLGLRPAGTAEQTLGVKVTETGVLAGLNYGAADQRAAIVATVAKGAAGILGALTRGGLAAGRDSSCAQASRARAQYDSTTHVVRTFDLTELPSSSNENMSATQTARTYSAYPRGAELFGLTNILLTVSPVPEPTTPLEAPTTAHGEPIGCPGAESACARIYYREPIMRLIRVFAPDRADATRATFAMREERIVPLVSAGDPILHLSFGTQTLGAGKIALTFGPHGNVTGVEQSSSAALAGAAAAATSAAEGARDTYLAALKARVDRLDLELKAARDEAAIHKAQASDSAIQNP